MCKISVLTAKKIYFSITKVRWSVLFKEITAVYYVNHAKPINALWAGKVQNYWVFMQVECVATTGL
jgi:hypothetical protein